MIYVGQQLSVNTKPIKLIKQAYLIIEEKNSWSTLMSRSRLDPQRHSAVCVACLCRKLETNFTRTINSNLTLSHYPSSLQATSNFPLNSNSLARLLASLARTSCTMRNEVRDLGEDFWLAFALLKSRLWIVQKMREQDFRNPSRSLKEAGNYYHCQICQILYCLGIDIVVQDSLLY